MKPNTLSTLTITSGNIVAEGAIFSAVVLGPAWKHFQRILYPTWCLCNTPAEAAEVIRMLERNHTLLLVTLAFTDRQLEHIDSATIPLASEIFGSLPY